MSDKLQAKYKAAIFDMDGVLTQTAQIHAKAWKEMFDEYLKGKQGDNFEPLDINRDYEKYIDGVLRQEGVRNFLQSRNINIPEGQPDDDPKKETLHGLGNRKNEMFLKVIDKEGVEVYQDALELLQVWQKRNVKLAVISSSRNCKHILEKAGIARFFEVRVDGVVSREQDLESKPAPDIFLKAAERLQSHPDETIVIEDAQLGVQAGKRGEFGLVVGVARHGENEALITGGADIVVKQLTELKDKIKDDQMNNRPEELPHALAQIDNILENTGGKQICLFLDYDGTLTPIVSNPDEALLSDKAREVIRKLSEQISVAIISGRDRKDVRSKAGIKNIIYAGSHGFDISGPDGLDMEHESGEKIIPVLDSAEKHLKEKLRPVGGVQVERKKYAIAVHFRNAKDNALPEIKEAVSEVLNSNKELKKGSGKKIIELKPDINWHKGKALIWLMEKLQLNRDKYIPVFIGDDETDEDALEVIKDDGIGIITGSHDQTTAAHYRLDDTDQVIEFLEKLKNHLVNRNHK